MNIKSILSLTLIATLALGASAQTTDAEKKGLRKKAEGGEDGWNRKGLLSANLTQTGLTNWAGGGQNSVAYALGFNYVANYKKGKIAWDNNIDMAYGSIRTQKSPFTKTDDRIELTSKYGRQLDSNLYFAVLGNFRTQFAPGYDDERAFNRTKISDVLSPGYGLLAIGLDYKPNNKLSAFIAPLTGKFTFVTAPSLSAIGAFGVDPGKTFRAELGGYLRIFYATEVMDNVTFQTKLDLFSNYLENPGNIDVNWETLTTLKVNDWLAATFMTHLIYDDDIDIAVDTDDDGITDALGPRAQFKQVLTVGLTYKF